MNPLLRKTQWSRSRIAGALAIAVLADALQLGLGPFGWAFADQLIDLLAMLLVSVSIGFHPLFLPTFAAEFIPGLNMIPTWTGCVLFVLARHWKQQRTAEPHAGAHDNVIDV